MTYGSIPGPGSTSSADIMATKAAPILTKLGAKRKQANLFKIL